MTRITLATLTLALSLSLAFSVSSAQEGGGQAAPLNLEGFTSKGEGAILDVFNAIKPKEELIETLAKEPEPDQPRPEAAIYITFKYGGTDLADERSRRQLEQAGLALSSPELKEHTFEIAGHTDSIGRAGSNLRLSQKRAEAVRFFLIEKYDLDPDRLIARGYGESLPAASNDTPQGRALNRRVVLIRLD